ncbi:MAG: hypothetical protein CVU98_08210 [Firmicutes bacterium HGW-Firmicutes-3]|nr:MAG: hypothetical protein CVU98_08210 [Firmicutes bacterium HGW-Firmicutes-3]
MVKRKKIIVKPIYWHLMQLLNLLDYADGILKNIEMTTVSIKGVSELPRKQFIHAEIKSISE